MSADLMVCVLNRSGSSALRCFPDLGDLPGDDSAELDSMLLARRRGELSRLLPLTKSSLRMVCVLKRSASSLRRCRELLGDSSTGVATPVSILGDWLSKSELLYPDVWSDVRDSSRFGIAALKFRSRSISCSRSNRLAVDVRPEN